MQSIIYKLGPPCLHQTWKLYEYRESTEAVLDIIYAMRSYQKWAVLATLSVVIPVSFAREGTDKFPTVDVLNGTYHGVHSQHYDQDVFLGVPYTQQPVDDVLLQIPHSLNTSWTKPRNATEYSPSCLGYGQSEGASESCLTLNVVRPGGTKLEDKLPVAVWLYGGGFTSGSSTDQRYNLSFIVEQSVKMGTPMIAISLNHRLHCWGLMW